MNSSDYIRIATRSWQLLVGAAVLGALLVGLGSLLLPATYRATTTMLVMQQTAQGPIQQSDLQTSALLARTFEDLITVRPLLQEAIARGGFTISADELREQIAIDHERDTQFINLTVWAGHPDDARDLANTIATVFIESPQAASALRAGIVSVVEPAVTPGSPSSPLIPVNAVLGALLGVAIASVAVIVRGDSDNVVESANDLEALRVPFIGNLPDLSGEPTADQLQVASYPRSLATDDFRSARARLSALLGENDDGSFARKVILVTSIDANASSSTAAANLAVLFGAAGYNVLLVDADLHNPFIHEVLALADRPGLTSHLTGSGKLPVRMVDIDTAHRPTGRRAQDAAANPPAYSSFAFIAAGGRPASPAEMLDSRAMRSMMATVRRSYELVILNSPPVLDGADASVIAAMADGVVVVTRAGKTRLQDVRQAANQFPGDQPAVLGALVVRDVPRAQTEDSLDEDATRVTWRAVSTEG